MHNKNIKSYNLSQQNIWDKMNLALKCIKKQDEKIAFVPKYIIRKAK